MSHIAMLTREHFIHITPAAELPGTFSRYAQLAPNQHGVWVQGKQVQGLASGLRHTLVGAVNAFFELFDQAWLATLPSEPMPMAVSLQINANEALADLLLLLTVQVSDPVKAVTWACRSNDGTLTPTPYDMAQLRNAVTEVVARVVNGVTYRYAIADLNSEQARGEIWRAVLGALAHTPQAWGLTFSSASNATLAIEPKRVKLINAERIAKHEAALDRINKDTQLDKTQREYEQEAILRAMMSDFGVENTMAILEASEAAPPPQTADSPPVISAPNEAAPPSLLSVLMNEVKAAIDGRTERELRRRTDAVIRSLEADKRSPTSNPKTATPSENQALVVVAPRSLQLPPWVKGIQWLKVLLAVMALSMTVIFMLLQMPGLAALGVFSLLIATTALPWVQQQLRQWLARRAQLALPAPPPAVWSLADRQYYDELVRGQIERQLTQVGHTLSEARKTLGKRGLFDDAAKLKEIERQNTQLAERLAKGEVGTAAYLMRDAIEVADFERLLDTDATVIAAGKQVSTLAREINITATSSHGLTTQCQTLRTTLINLEQVLNERGEFLQKKLGNL